MSRDAFSDINVTPMADIMIVLLIIFMVVTPMMNDVPGLLLPAATHAKDTEDGPLDIVARADGTLEMAGERFASPAELSIRTPT